VTLEVTTGSATTPEQQQTGSLDGQWCHLVTSSGRTTPGGRKGDRGRQQRGREERQRWGSRGGGGMGHMADTERGQHMTSLQDRV